MKTTVSVDKDLLDEAKRITRINCTDTLMQDGLRALIQQVEASRALAKMGGTMPELKSVPRRRLEPE